MEMTNKVYDVLKWLTMVGLPAFAVLYTTLAPVWGFPYAQEIQATILAVVTFLGVVLQISSAKHTAKKEE
jgi:hypothetical protein